MNFSKYAYEIKEGLKLKDQVVTPGVGPWSVLEFCRQVLSFHKAMDLWVPTESNLEKGILFQYAMECFK